MQGIPRNCNFCGLCCTQAVRVTEEDIQRIEKLGHKREDFTVKDVDGQLLLKRENGYCTFFRDKGNYGGCSIYENRPDICRDWPGKKICDLKDNVLFKNMDNKHPNIKKLWKRAPEKDDIPPELPQFPES